MSTVNVTTEQLDMFSKHAQQAMEVASKSISEIAGTGVDVKPAKVNILPLHAFYKLLGDPEEVRTTVVMNIEKGLGGAFAFSIPEGDVSSFVDKVLKMNDIKGDKDELATSAIEDVANILVGAFLAELSSMCKIPSIHSTPSTVTDMIHATLDEVVFQFAGGSKEALIFNAELSMSPLVASPTLMLIVDSKSAEKLLSCMV